MWCWWWYPGVLTLPTLGLITGELRKLIAFGLRIAPRSPELLVIVIEIILLERNGNSGGGFDDWWCCCCCRYIVLPAIELTSTLDMLKLEDICEEEADEELTDD